uniref:CTL-like protein 2 n=1 Tax=Culex pipiens TaxID=7175 RepID=A0A8D8GSB1_CULPI
MARHDDGESYGQPLKFDPDFKGPLSKRSCTDIPCLFLFVAFLAGWGFVAYYALHHGDLDRLLVPTDSKGLKCGVDSEVQDKPYLFFFDISECAKYDVPLYGCKTPQVCVSKCPAEQFGFELNACNAATLDTFRSKLICDQTVPKDSLSCSEIQDNIDRGHCARYYLKSVPFAKRCISDLPDTECPYIPPKVRQQYHVAAAPPQQESGFRNGKQMSAEMKDCSNNRRLGRQLLEERMTRLQSYFARYVDNLLSHVTNDTRVHQVRRTAYCALD